MEAAHSNDRPSKMTLQAVQDDIADIFKPPPDILAGCNKATMITMHMAVEEFSQSRRGGMQC